MPPDFQFNAATHTYTLRGRQIPGVTQVLSALGYLKGLEYFTEVSRERGRLIHAACEALDLHCPQATSIEEVREVLDLGSAAIPYIEGYLLFKHETGFQVEMQEIPVYSPLMQVAGKFDKLGIMRDGHKVLLDLKSWRDQGCKPKRSAELQMGFYASMIQDYLKITVEQAFVLKLPGDGGYRLYLCKTLQLDGMIAQHAARVYWDLKNHGLLSGVAQTEAE